MFFDKLSKYFITSSLLCGNFGFSLGFMNCKVSKNPLIFERLVAGSTLGIFFGISGSLYVPLSSLFYLDCMINNRNTDLYLKKWRNAYYNITGPSGYKYMSYEELHRPYPVLTTKEIATNEKKL